MEEKISLYTLKGKNRATRKYKESKRSSLFGSDKKLPFKNSKKIEITPLQKQINKGISSLRIKVEHAFSSIKRLKILKQKINLKRNEIKHQVMIVATALHNLRVQFRLLNN